MVSGVSSFLDVIPSKETSAVVYEREELKQLKHKCQGECQGTKQKNSALIRVLFDKGVVWSCTNSFDKYSNTCAKTLRSQRKSLTGTGVLFYKCARKNTKAHLFALQYRSR